MIVKPARQRIEVLNDDFFSEAVEEFRYQWKHFGYYDSAHDPGWRWERSDLGTFIEVAERRWRPAWRGYVPARLWDKGTPTVMCFFTEETACRG